MTENRCRAGRRCREAENMIDPNTGERIDRLGALLHDGAHLCGSCSRHVDYALGSLPYDVQELSWLLVPTKTVRLRDPNLPHPRRVRTEAPLPLREDVLTLQELIDHETSVWARSLARHHDLRWSAYDAAHSRQLERVSSACRLLARNLHQLIELPTQEHRARSLSTRRADGHDENTATRYGDDYWTYRDGPTGALLLLELHERALRYAGRHPGDRIPTPCPACHRPALIREHRTNRVVCRACYREMSDDDYDGFLQAAYRAHGIDYQPYTEDTG